MPTLRTVTGLCGLRLHLDIVQLQGALAGWSAAGAAAPARRSTRPRYPFKFDTRHNSFGVLPQDRGGLSGVNQG